MAKKRKKRLVKINKERLDKVLKHRGKTKQQLSVVTHREYISFVRGLNKNGINELELDQVARYLDISPQYLLHETEKDAMPEEALRVLDDQRIFEELTYSFYEYQNLVLDQNEKQSNPFTGDILTQLLIVCGYGSIDQKSISESERLALFHQIANVIEDFMKTHLKEIS